MRVAWTEQAAAELEAIREHMVAQSPAAAAALMAAIARRLDQLEAFPESGRIVPEYRIPLVREVIVGPYRVLYRLAVGHIEILGVFHGARAVLDE